MISLHKLEVLTFKFNSFDNLFKEINDNLDNINLIEHWLNNKDDIQTPLKYIEFNNKVNAKLIYSDLYVLLSMKKNQENSLNIMSLKKSGMNLFPI